MTVSDGLSFSRLAAAFEQLERTRDRLALLARITAHHESTHGAAPETERRDCNPRRAEWSLLHCS